MISTEFPPKKAFLQKQNQLFIFVQNLSFLLELLNFSSIIIIFPIFVAPQIIRIVGKIKFLRIYEIAILFQKNQIFDKKLFENYSF
jgi:hypothetical protein